MKRDHLPRNDAEGRKDRLVTGVLLTGARCFNKCKRAGDIKGELLTVWGRQDPHVPLNGRNLIRARLEEVGANFQWHEVNGQHAFLRDEGPRYDPALAYHCYGLVFELFHRRLGSGDLAD